MGRIGLEASQKREQVPPQYEATKKLADRSAIAGAVFGASKEAAPVLDIEPDLEVLEVEAVEVVVAPVTPAPKTESEELDLDVELESGTAAAPIYDREADLAAVSIVDRDAVDFERKLDNQAQVADMNGKNVDGSNNGFRMSGARANARLDDNSAKKREEEDKKFAQLRKQLADHIKWLDEQIEKLRRDISKTDDIISALRNGEELALDENGELVDKEAERILRAYEERTGETVDRRNREAMLQAFEEQQEYQIQTEQRLQRERERAAELERAGQTLSEDELRRELPSYSKREQDTATSQMEDVDASKVRRAAGYADDSIDKLEDERDTGGFGGPTANSFFPPQSTSIASNVSGNHFNAPDLAGQFASAHDGVKTLEPSPGQESAPKVPQFQGFA